MRGEPFSRRSFLGAMALGVGALSCTDPSSPTGRYRPNILWLVSEDNGPFLGCYGDKNAITPNLDRLASEGILYENAYANAPICAPARFTIATGVYACSAGTQHMRSYYRIPPLIRFYPQYLREIGYYCTNNAKEDYNVANKPRGTWDESSDKAHWKNRKPDQPFFAVFNILASHERFLHKSQAETDHDPARVDLPPYHPDTPEFRHDWAQYYDCITLMDVQMGERLKELEDAGLAEDTIVFYYSDHGGVLPRSKRFLYDSGIHVPMIIRFPKKYRHLAPAEPGTRTDRLVSFVDLAPTLLSLVGIPTPAHMQGEAFLGPYATKPRDYVYGFRDREGERYDLFRMVRDKRFKYIRNFMPHLSWAQHLRYLYQMPAMRSWQKLYDEGKLTGAQKIYFQTKPVEELYDTTVDPHEVNNLADDPAYRKTLETMRKVCQEWMFEVYDSGLLPEEEMCARAEGSTIYEMVRDKDKYHPRQCMKAAHIANLRDPKQVPQLLELLKHKDSAVRYWAVTGLLALGEQARPAVEELSEALEDPSHDVRIVAAHALCALGDTGRPLEVLEEALGLPYPDQVLRGANALDYLDETARPVLERFVRNPSSGQTFETCRRVLDKAMADLNIKPK